MTVSVLVPWREGCPHRDAAWAWVQDRYAQAHSDWQVVTGGSGDGPFSRSQAILDAAGRADGDVLVVADADVWCDPQPAVDAVTQYGWAVPHLLVHRLAADSTAEVLAGADWRGLALSSDNPQDSRPYRGHETGTLVVLRCDVLDDVPPDPRFVGWGHEDDAWAAALKALVGKAWRGDADLVHLWHPPQPRQSRRVGNPTSERLGRRYRNASRSPLLARRLVEEGKAWHREMCASSAVESSPS